jgi:S1-C subfamily serine protease
MVFLIKILRFKSNREGMADFTRFYKSIVRIIAHDVGFDWLMPFQKMSPREGSGSGFFVDKQGHILTCAHVVENASHLFVEIPSEGDRRYEAEILGVCPFFDLAVIKVKEYKNKSFCKLDSGKTMMEPGMETYALGYPLGMPHMKVSKGIISGQQYNFYQTDTAINPGNSGGPLLYKGRVIGVNAAGMPAWEADGIGYAVPIQRYYSIESLLYKQEKPCKLISYPQYFGFEDYQPTSVDFQKYIGNKCEHGGVYIKKVLPKSPVSTTGLKKGDIVCKINDVEVDYYGGLNKRWMNENMSIENMLVQIGLHNPVKITYWNGKTVRKEQFELVPYDPHIRLMYPAFEKIEFEAIAGMVVMNLSVNLIMILGGSDLHQYMKPKNVMQRRLVVSNLLVGSYLSKLNILNKGDLLVKVNDRAVSTVTEFRKAFPKAIEGQYIKLETESNKLVIIPVQEVLREESRLSKEYIYKESNLIKKLSP